MNAAESAWVAADEADMLARHIVETAPDAATRELAARVAVLTGDAARIAQEMDDEASQTLDRMRRAWLMGLARDASDLARDFLMELWKIELSLSVR